MLKIAQTDVKTNTGTYACTIYIVYMYMPGFHTGFLLGGEKLFCIIWYWMRAEHAAFGRGGLGAYSM